MSEASASGLIKPVVIDPKEFPIVRWRWKIDNVLQHSDVALKEGDDFPARLYFTFEYDPDKVSFSARSSSSKPGKRCSATFQSPR